MPPPANRTAATPAMKLAPVTLTGRRVGEVKKTGLPKDVDGNK